MVTYHPSAPTIDNIKLILPQVDAIVVVDNGSDAHELISLQRSSREAGFRLIENSENRGIAEALNQGIRWAKSQGYSWVVLFDQDSTVSPHFIEQMLASVESHPQRERVVSMHPRYADRDTGVEPPFRRAKDGGPIISMTSGALMPMWIFDRIGYFASEFFIDCVDHEYCFRARAAGFCVADSTQAVLLHSPGHPALMKVLGYSFTPTHHSAIRRYYMSRNRVVVFRKYIRVFPAWILQYGYVSFRETIKCFLAEQDRVRNLRYFLLGTWDGLTGKMGRRKGL
jgi:rhamnosyltransferase